jgi:hypothetical protein
MLLNFKELVAPNNTAVDNNLQTNTKFVRVLCSCKLFFIVRTNVNNEIILKFRCLPSVLHAVTIQKTTNYIITFFRTSVFFLFGSPMCPLLSDILQVQYMLDMFSPRKSSSYLSKDADLGFRKDEAFRSDPFPLHVIEQLIYSPKLLLRKYIN